MAQKCFEINFTGEKLRFHGSSFSKRLLHISNHEDELLLGQPEVVFLFPYTELSKTFILVELFNNAIIRGFFLFQDMLETGGHICSLKSMIKKIISKKGKDISFWVLSNILSQKIKFLHAFSLTFCVLLENVSQVLLQLTFC